MDPFHAFLVLDTPDLDTAWQMGPCEGKAEEDNHLPCPVVHPSFNAAHSTVVFLGYKCTLSVHVEIFHPPTLSCSSPQGCSQSTHCTASGIVLAQVQDLTLGLVELQEVHTGPPLKAVRFSLDDTPSLHRVHCTIQFGAIHKHAEGALLILLSMS